MLDRLTSMAVFVRAAEAGSFAAVAESLGMTPQMVAKHIAALERQLGTRLIQRTTRRQSLTEFGQLYLERCHTILAEVEAADTLAQTAQAEPRGRLRLNAPVTFGRYGLMPLVTGFLRAFPAVEIDVVLSDRLVDPVDEGFRGCAAHRRAEPAVGTGGASPAALPAAGLRLTGLPCSARHAHEPADLAGHECVGFSAWPSAFSRQWRFVRDGTEHAVAVGSRLNLSDWGAMYAAALDGYGIVFGYERAVATDLAAGRLVRVLEGYELPARPMHLLYAADRRMTPKLRAFVDWMLRALGPMRRRLVRNGSDLKLGRLHQREGRTHFARFLAGAAAEQALELAVELRGALVAHAHCCASGGDMVADHHQPCLVQPHRLDVLNGRGCGHGLEMRMEGRHAQARLTRQRSHVQRLGVVGMDAPQHPRDSPEVAVAGQGRADGAASFPKQNTEAQFANDGWPENPCFQRRAQSLQQAYRGIGQHGVQRR